MKIYTLPISLLMLIFLLISCNFDKVEEPEPEVCDAFDATYNGDVKAIIDATCAIAGCHVNGTGVPGDYATYLGMEDFLKPDEIEFRVINLKDNPDDGMPPDWPTNPGPKDLTDEQFEIFECWIQNGYPEN